MDHQNTTETIPVENQIKMHKAMEKYNVDWWNSPDPREVAKYQLFEPILLVD